MAELTINGTAVFAATGKRLRQLPLRPRADGVDVGDRFGRGHGRRLVGGFRARRRSKLIQVLQAAATGLEPMQPYVLALSDRADGRGKLEPLASFTTNPAGSAIVNATGPIRQLVRSDAPAPAAIS